MGVGAGPEGWEACKSLEISKERTKSLSGERRVSPAWMNYRNNPRISAFAQSDGLSELADV